MALPMLECSVYPVTWLTALRSVCLPTDPASPPERKLPPTAASPGEPDFRYPPPPLLPPPFRCIELVKLRPAIRSSAIMFPPVFPTLIPRLDMKESIFWLTFRNAMAHRNQIKTFPVTASFPWSATACSTSASVSSEAKTGIE